MAKDEFKDVEKEFFEGGERPEAEPVIDEKLIRSMRPSWQRNPYISLIVIAAALYFMYQLWPDAYFALKYGILGNGPEDLGSVEEAVKSHRLEHNSYVKLRGIPWIQSMFFVPIRGRITRTSGPIKGYHTYFILVGSDNRVIVEGRSKRRKLPEKYSDEYVGRLMRLDRIDIGPTLRAFYYDNVEGLERDVRLAPLPSVPYSQEELKRMEDNRAQLGKPRPVFVDSDGERYSPSPDTLVDIKVLYRGDAVFSFDTKFTVDSSITIEAGECAPDATQTGAVRVLYDVRTVNPPAGVVKVARSGTRTVKVPIGTLLTEEGSTQPLGASRQGVLYTLGPLPCGKTKKVVLHMKLRPYATRGGVHRWLVAHDLPFVPLTAKDRPVDDRWNVIVRVDDDDLKKYLRMPNIRRVCETIGKGVAATRQCNIAIAAMVVDPRWEYLMKVRFGSVRFMDDKMVVMPARTDFPTKYRIATEGVDLGEKGSPIVQRVRILEPEPPAEAYSVPIHWVLALQFRQKVEVPADAFLLRTGTDPHSWSVMWTVAAELVLLLLLFFNVRAVIRWWSER